MKVSIGFLDALKEYITGAWVTPNASGAKLVELFNSFGFKDIYGGSGDSPLSPIKQLVQ